MKRAPAAFYRVGNRKMARDRSFNTEFPRVPGFSRYNNNNSFNITGFLNNNTSSLNNNSNCFNTNTNCGNVSNVTVTDDRSEILTWLSPLEPRLRHYDIQTRRVDKVGDWLLRTEQFQSWRSGDQSESQKATMFCSGNPGVGKTYINSLIIDTLGDRAGEASEQNIVVACFYFDFAAQKEQSAESMLSALLKQVVGGLEPIPEEIVDMFEEQKKVIGGRRLRLPEIVKMLGNLSSSQRTFFCLDALDECAEGDRAKILTSLGAIIKISPTTRLFITGRPHVRGEVETHLPGGAAVVGISPQKNDIIRYIRKKLAEDSTLGEPDEILEAEIVKKISEAVSEMYVGWTEYRTLLELSAEKRASRFLLVSLSIDAVLQETTIYRRRERLRVMTDGLGLEGAYGATLERIKAQGSQKSELGMAALMWISYSERPLRVEELCQALAIKIGSTEYNSDNVSSIRTVLSCCQGLAVVDREGSTIRLVHFTLQEYLTSHPDLFRSPHAVITETCLTYLNSQQVMALPASGSLSAQHPPFLQYAALYWGAHMKKELSDRGKTLALKLFSHYERHISIKLLLEHTVGLSVGLIANSYKFAGLHYACMFGLVELVSALTKIDGVDTNHMDDTDATPLIWAARNGHGAVVKVLLGRGGVDPNLVGDFGRAPISWAAGNGHEGVVKLLLAHRDVDPDVRDYFGRRPISWAAEHGHEAVIKLLLGRGDVHPGVPDGLGRTPILWAAKCGDEAVVGLFLRCEDINPDRPDRFGRAPISWAAEYGHGVVVRQLLTRKDVNPNRLDIDCQTPISRAAMNEHERVVKLFLAHEDVNPNRPDNDGQTLLSRAAMNGQKRVVRLLLGLEDINPDMQDGLGRTPISWAAEYGCEAVVKLLLECKDISLNRPDPDGQTPISRAAMNGHEGALRLLLGRKDVDPDMPDNYGRTPVSWAAELGYGVIMKLLLAHSDVNPNRPDNYGQTLISRATTSGQEEVVKLLLGRTDIDPDTVDDFGRTPISWAAGYGHSAVMGLLLARDDVNPNRPDTDGRTPILQAAINGHDGVVRLLLEREDVSPDMPDNFGRTPLSWAAECGHEAVVKLLLAREDIKLDILDNDSQTPLSRAAINGHEGVVRLLLEWKDVSPDMPDNLGRTPISWAAEHGHEAVVKLLLERGDVNPNRRDDGWCRTPILWAAENGYGEVVKLFLEREDVNPNRRDICGLTLYSYAAIGRDHPVAKLIRDLKALPAPPIYSR